MGDLGAFEEHWCRLKGNLLVILRTDDRTSTDLLGVILLEHCSVSLVSEADVQHAFKIEFKSGDASILMAARSAAEAKMWCRHISAAGISELVALQAHLREELRKRTGTDPLDPLNKPASNATTIAEPDEFTTSGLELQFCLLFDSHSTSQVAVSSLRITVSIQEPGESTWRIVAETETETKDSPTFHKAVKVSSDMFTESATIRLSLMELQDLRSAASKVVAVTTVSAAELCNASTLQLRMCEPPSSVVPFGSPTLASSKETGRAFCTLVIQVKKFQPQSDCSQSDPHSARLRSVCENILSQNYIFYHTLGENMRVVELMGESKLGFQFPIEYVKHLIQREHLLYDSLSRAGMSNPHLECLRRERLLGMKGVIERYELCLRAMVDRVGPNFKRSTERKNGELDFVPTNLHVNRIGLLDSENGLVSFHDITSVGAFSTASSRYKCRGLFQTAFSNASGDVGQPFPPSRLNLEDFADRLPSTAAVLQLESHPVGVAIKRLADGAALVVQLHSDLGELKTRLQAVGQAVLLTERLDSDISTLNALLSSYSDVFASELAAVHENHEELLHRIVLLATFEKMQTVSLNTPASPFGSAAQKPVDFCDLEGLERPLLLQQISDSAARLDASLNRAWERAEESLWTTVLKGIINSAACNGSTDGCSSVAAAAASVSSETTTAVPTSTPSSADLAAASNLWDNVNYRHHAVVCQALAASLTGLAVAVTRWLTVQWQQMIECGVPLYFEGLLSCYGQEAEMLENWAWAIQFLVYWSVIVRPDGRTVDNTADNEKAAVETDTTSAMPVTASPLVRITGYKQCVLTIPQSAWKQVPPEYQTRGSVVLYLRPYAFNVGINEQQTIAERRANRFLRHWMVTMVVENLGCVSRFCVPRGAEFATGCGCDENVKERQLFGMLFFPCELNVGENAVKWVLKVGQSAPFNYNERVIYAPATNTQVHSGRR
nr:unnamed protein product [Spirometra erinaceieuropaei]